MNTDFKPDWKSPPYDTIRDLLEERGLSSHFVKYALCLGTDSLSKFQSGELKIDEAIAYRIVETFGGTKEFWLERQRQYDNQNEN